MSNERSWKISKGAGAKFISGPDTTDGNGDPGYVEVVPESIVQELIEAWDDAHVPMSTVELDGPTRRLYNAVREARTVLDNE